MERFRSEALDAILGEQIKVLDDGFIRVVDYMGTDASIVQAARVSYGEGTKKVHEDRGLIRYLLRHRHTTPFEMCEIKLHVRVPMDCWRQWIRHRTANVNEYSTRYSVAIDSAQTTLPGEWRAQAESNRQGSSGKVEVWPEDFSQHTWDDSDPVGTPGEYLSEREKELQRLSREIYEERLSLGVAREQARKDLPLSTYTEAYWKIDLHNFLHFVGLRADGHAQYEIQQFANVMCDILSKWVPATWEAFQDYRVGAMFLTKIEADIIRKINRTAFYDAIQIAEKAGWLKEDKNGNLKRNRERQECEDKLVDLGIEWPWRREPKQ